MHVSRPITCRTYTVHFRYHFFTLTVERAPETSLNHRLERLLFVVFQRNLGRNAHQTLAMMWTLDKMTLSI